MRRFRKGDYSTKFIPNEYPEGFHGVKLNKHETTELIALAAAMHSAGHEQSNSIKQERANSKEEIQMERKMAEMRQLHHLHGSMRDLAPKAAQHPTSEEEEDDEEYGVHEEVVIVLGGTKGKAYLAHLSLGDMLRVKISPMDKNNIPDLTKSTTVSAELV